MSYYYYVAILTSVTAVHREIDHGQTLINLQEFGIFPVRLTIEVGSISHGPRAFPVNVFPEKVPSPFQTNTPDPFPSRIVHVRTTGFPEVRISTPDFRFLRMSQPSIVPAP